MVSRLPVDKKFDFEVYKVEPIKSERYPGLKNTPVDVIGFRIKDNTPVKTTRIFPAHAIDNNGRLQVNGTLRVLIGAQWDKNGGNPNSYGLFFLLKK